MRGSARLPRCYTEHILGNRGVTELTQRRDGRDGSVKSGLAGVLADNRKGGILSGSAAPSCTSENLNGPGFRQLMKEMEQRRNSLCARLPCPLLSPADRS